MNVGLCVVEIHLPGSRSLKDKRRVIRHLKDRIRAKFNVAVAEVDHQDLWQRATLGMVSISSSAEPVESCFRQIRSILEQEAEGDLASFHVEFLA